MKNMTCELWKSEIFHDKQNTKFTKIWNVKEFEQDEKYKKYENFENKESEGYRWRNYLLV